MQNEKACIDAYTYTSTTVIFPHICPVDEDAASLRNTG
jgi:hypothetical protein